MYSSDDVINRKEPAKMMSSRKRVRVRVNKRKEKKKQKPKKSSVPRDTNDVTGCHDDVIIIPVGA